MPLLLHFFLTYPSTLPILAKTNPIPFFKPFSPPVLLAFTTSTTNPVLPLSIQTPHKPFNLPDPISTFLHPLPPTINMDRTAIMQGLATIFIA
ncbi:dicarboxylate/amino acid:cation symporter, partial [Bacillus pumilus]|uniref:dicarboxylate/amino acid:cation symporter n=1 Tax=Bacillus pumilus TaxID=1408 RepID=UPI0021B3D6C7